MQFMRNRAIPYTLGLLRSIPRLDLGRQKRLIPIEGLPPDLLEPPTRCPLHPVVLLSLINVGRKIHR